MSDKDSRIKSFIPVNIFNNNNFLSDCVQPCLLFFLCVPTSYVLLVIYALTNLNANAWGTREDIFIPNRKKKQKFKSQAECLQFLEQQFANAKNSNELLAVVENLIDECYSQRTESSDQLLAQITAVLNRINMFDDLDKRLNKGLDLHGLGLEALVEDQEKYQNENPNHDPKQQELLLTKYDERSHPYWFDHHLVKYADVKYLNENEFHFWRRLIQKYLKPIHMDALEKQKLQLGLNDLRDQGVFAFFMLDALWIAFVFSVLLAQNRLKDMLFIPVPIPSSYNDHAMIEPLGVMLIFCFGIICLIQFIAMLCHRYNTFQHILASTKLRSSKFEGVRIEDIMDIVKMLQQIKVKKEKSMKRFFIVDLFSLLMKKMNHCLIIAMVKWKKMIINKME
jgi:chitin synthase